MIAASAYDGRQVGRRRAGPILDDGCTDAAAKEKPEVYAICVLGFFTGMRLGEIAALRWKDVSENEGLIHIRQSV